MLWYSAGKPLTTVAVLQLWERGPLALDDPIGRFLPGWGNGKERATLRQVLIHTGGFPMYGDPGFDRDISAEESLARIVATPAAWEPGTKAGYHPVSGWKVLGAVVEAVDGRPIERYLHDEVLTPLGCTESSLGVPFERQVALGDRLVPVAWKGHMFPHVDDDGALSMVPYRIDEIHNEPWHIAKVEPGASMRGPARELGRFYESLLGHGPALLEPRTVELMGAVHRLGLKRRAVRLRDAVGPRRRRRHDGRRGSTGVRPRRDGVVTRAVRSRPRAGDGAGVQRPAQPARRGGPPRRGHRHALLGARRRRAARAPPRRPRPRHPPRHLSPCCAGTFAATGADAVRVSRR